MELEELKQKWNKFDEQLSKSEVYNRRMLQELLKGKNQTHYERMRKQALFNLFTTLFVPVVVIPLLHNKGIFHDTSFYLLEAVCLLGLLMVPWHLPDALFRERHVAYWHLFRSPGVHLRTAVRLGRVEEASANDAGDRKQPKGTEGILRHKSLS